jgi:hypothetical protein
MITLRSLPTLTLTLLLPLAACGDDGSTASTAASSGSTTALDPSTGSTTAVDPTAVDPTAAAETSTGPAATDGSTGPGASSTGPGDTEATTDAAGLEIAGTWLEEFSPGRGVDHVIDETAWEQLSEFGDAVFHVGAYDNAARFVVAQGDAANAFYPELWSRFDWTWDGDALYYCTAVFDAPTLEDALAAPATDPADLAMGCGGFPWSALVPSR